MAEQRFDEIVSRLLSADHGALADLPTAFADDPWAVGESCQCLWSEAPRSGDVTALVFAARAVLAEASEDLAVARLCWRIAAQEAKGGPTVVDATTALDRLDAASMPVVADGVRVELSSLLGLPSVTAAQLARRLQQHDDRLRAATFPTDEPALGRQAVAWVADAFGLAALLDVFDPAVVVLHLADRDPGVSEALRRAEALQSLRAEGAPVAWQPSAGERRLAVGPALTPPGRRDGAAITAAEWMGSGTVLLGDAAGGLRRWSVDDAPHEAGSDALATMLLDSPQGSAAVDQLDVSRFVLVRRGPELWAGRRQDEGLAAALRPPGSEPGTVNLQRVVPANEGGASATALAGTGADGTVLFAELTNAGPELLLRALVDEPVVRSVRENEGLLLQFDPDAKAVASSGALPGSGPDGAEAFALAVGATAGGVVVLAGDGERLWRWFPAWQEVRPLDHGGSRVTAMGRGSVNGRTVLAIGLDGLDGGSDPDSVPLVGVALLDSWSGDRIAWLPTAGRAVDCSFAVVGGQPLMAVTDADGVLTGWNLDDLTVVTAPDGPITGVRAARFGVVDGAAHVLLRTIDGQAEVRPLELVQVVDQVPEYRSDTVADAASRAPGERDPLHRDPEAMALAEVLTSTTVQPPLAIGLFGEWGEGKSYFLARLRKHMEVRTAAAGDTGLTCREVRTVEFNAWHYAEADLWASLMAELFEQLTTGEQGVGQRGMALLQAEMVRKQQLKERLNAAEEELRAVETRLAQKPPPFERLAESEREALVAALGPERAKSYYEAWVSSPEVRRKWRGLLSASWRRIVDHKALSVLSVVVVAAAIGLVTLGGGAAVIGAAVAGIAVLQPVWTGALQLRRAWSGVMTKLDETAARVRADPAEREQLETQRDVLGTQVGQLQGAYERSIAAGQLAGVIESRLTDGTYRSRLGLMSQIRRDFDAMAELLRADPDPDLPHIDRIVLMIDDLDRCPPKRVVEVLEAIQLLLAVPLFVVVVAVDPRWLLRSLTEHYRNLLADDEAVTGGHPVDADLWRSTPLHYLEKIFQIPFTLAPLDPDGFKRYIEDLVGATSAGSAGRGAPAGTPPAETTLDEPAPDDDAEPDGTPTGAGPGPATPLSISPLDMTPTVPRPPDADQVSLLVLDEQEKAMLGLLGPPLVPTPRAAKRLVNSYYLLLGIVGDEGRTAIVGPTPRDGRDLYPHRAALVLLALLAGAPDSAPAFFEALARAPEDRSWTDHLDLQRQLGDPAERLADQLLRLTADAAHAGRPLPDLVGDWQPWVVPCGRLSFRTGRVVVRLRD